MSKYLITGTAGFIGFHLAKTLLNKGNEVVGLDNINDYYDVSLKYARLNQTGIKNQKVEWNKLICSEEQADYRFIRMNLEDKENVLNLFKAENFEYVIHLAAQAGVRFSIDHPDNYINSNIIGFFNILEACRHFPVKHFLYASSSSVYGNNKKVPFSEDDDVNYPISLYAATKKSNELMAYTYNHLYNLKTTGLRFFTVYGPWGRPDMAIFRFTDAVLNNKSIRVFGEGKLLRDFTYIDDIINGIVAILEKQRIECPPLILNIGNHKPVSVNYLVSKIEKYLGMKAIIEYLPVQPGDVNATFADINRIYSYCGFKPTTELNTGLKKFIDWFVIYRKGQSSE